MFKNRENFLVLILNMAFISGVFAEPIIYKIVKKNGEVVYSDRLPADEKGQYSVLSAKSGVLKNNVQRELTKNEVNDLEEKNKDEKKNLLNNELQRKKDSALLSTYSNIAEIDKMKKFEINQIQQSINNGIESIANVKDRISQNQDQMKVSPNNKRLLENNQKLVEELNTTNKTLDYNKDLLDKRSSKYDEDKSRYQQILKSMAEASNQNDINK